MKEGGNTIIGLPEEAKYGMTREQVFEAYKQLQAKGVKHFGLHTMVVSNELDIDGLVGTAEICFNLAVEIKEKLGIDVEFIDLGGGVGVAYKPEQTPVDFENWVNVFMKPMIELLKAMVLRILLWPTNVVAW